MNFQIQSLSPGFERRRLLSAPSHASLPRSSAPDRVVTITSVSDRVPTEFISETFSHTLRAETGSSVLLIHIGCAGGRLSWETWVELSSKVNGEFALNNYLETTEGGVCILRLLSPGKLTDREFLSALVTHCAAHFQLLVLHPGSDIPLPVLLQCFLHSDRSFLLLQPRPEDLYSRDLLLREVRSLPQAGNLNLRTIACREKGEECFNELLKSMDKTLQFISHALQQLIKALLTLLSTCDGPQIEIACLRKTPDLSQ